MVHRDKTAAACCIHRDGRPSEVKGVGNSVGRDVPRCSGREILRDRRHIAEKRIVVVGTHLPNKDARLRASKLFKRVSGCFHALIYRL